jgi:hypothetical protein
MNGRLPSKESIPYCLENLQKKSDPKRKKLVELATNLLFEDPNKRLTAEGALNFLIS